MKSPAILLKVYLAMCIVIFLSILAFLAVDFKRIKAFLSILLAV